MLEKSYRSNMSRAWNHCCHILILVGSDKDSHNRSGFWTWHFSIGAGDHSCSNQGVYYGVDPVPPTSNLPLFLKLNNFVGCFILIHILSFWCLLNISENTFKKNTSLKSNINHPASTTQLHPLAHQIEAIHQLRPCKGRGIATWTLVVTARTMDGCRHPLWLVKLPI